MQMLFRMCTNLLGISVGPTETVRVAGSTQKGGLHYSQRAQYINRVSVSVKGALSPQPRSNLFYTLRVVHYNHPTWLPLS